MSINGIHISDTYQKQAYNFGSRIGLILTQKIIKPKIREFGITYPKWYMNNNFKINILDEINKLYPDKYSGYDHIWENEEQFMNLFYQSFKNGFTKSMNFSLKRNIK